MNKKILAVIFIIPFISLIFWTMWLYTQQVTGTEIKALTPCCRPFVAALVRQTK